MSIERGRGVAALVLAGALAGAGGAPAVAQAERADLMLTKVSRAPATVIAGDAFRLTTTVRNAGARRAKATTVVAYLSKDARRGPTDIRLQGARKVAALRRDEAAKGAKRVSLPHEVPAGYYRVIACADAKGAVKERSESNNCRTAPGSLAVPVTTPPIVPPPPADGD